MDVTSQWIEIGQDDGSHEGRAFEGYLALPPKGSGPGLVLFQEIFGVNSHIRACADMYARNGYVVLAPDLFWRQRPRTDWAYSGADFQAALRDVEQLDMGMAVRDAMSSLATLKARSEVSGKVATLGYCLGGSLSFLTAAVAAGNLDAAVSFYGGAIHAHLDQAADVRCPMQLHYGAKDKMIPPEAVQRVMAAFDEKPAEIHVYDQADHGFNCWERPSYHQPSAALSHGRALQFLSTHLS